MQLPFFPQKSKANVIEHDYLLALEISPQVVKCAVWSVINSQTQVVSVGDQSKWDDVAVESMIAASDIAISSAVERMGDDRKLNINKVILGLSSAWISGDKITDNKMTWIRQLAQKMELVPVGFVVTSEAVMRFVQHNEGTPLTAILLGFWPQKLDMSLVRLGKTDGLVEVARSPNLTDDVVEGLSRFPKVDMLPSRMLLYDSGIDLEDIKQLLLSYPWLSPTRKFGFLHFPKVEILPPDFTVRAIALSGGQEVAVSLGLIEKPSEQHPEVSPLHDLTAKDFGFSPDETTTVIPETVIIEPKEEIIKPKFSLPKITLPKPNFNFSLKPLLLIAVIMVLISMVAGFVWVVPKATVNLGFQTKTIDHNFIADLPVSEVEETTSGSEIAVATGSKMIGDKASGVVTIINSVASPKTFPKGTTISSPSGLKFIFDKEVQVASASGTADNKTLGKNSVEVTAVQVGIESNLSAGTYMQIGTLATVDVVAKNEAAFSGGTSRQVKAVAKTDVENLRTKILADVKAQVRQKLLDKASSQTLITDSITVSTVGEDLDHKIGDSAEDITLKVTVRAKGSVVAKSDLDGAIANAILPLVPSGFEVQSTSARNISAKKSSVSISVVANLIPKIDVLSTAKNIAGKNLDRATEYLHTLPGISKIEFVISPPLPIITSRLPIRFQRIDVRVFPL